MRIGDWRSDVCASDLTGGGGGEIETRGKGGLRASTLFLATGKHEVRGTARPVTEPCHNIGLKQMFALSPRQRERLAGAVELYQVGRASGRERVWQSV